MAYDVLYILSNSILWIIQFFIFIICFDIYKNTKGASLAYKKWATGLFLLLLGSTIYLIFGVVFEANETSTRDINEFHKILGHAIEGFGYFYLPVGIMYLSKDMGFGKVNEDTIRKSQIIFFGAIISIFLILMSSIIYFSIIKIIGISYRIIYLVIWVFTIYYFRDIYSMLKGTNKCWLYLYIGLFAAFFNALTRILFYFIPIFDYISVVFQLILAIGFIGGFLKLAKMVEAI